MSVSFGQMQSDLQLAGMANLVAADYGALLNRAQAEEADQYPWSFLLTNTVIYSAAPYTTGSVSITQGSNIVTGTGTAWTTAFAGFQLRFGPSGMALPVGSVQSPTQLTLAQPYLAPTVTNISYTLQQSLYVIPNASEVTAVKNLVFLEKVSREQLNLQDPQRLSVGGNPCLAWAPAPYFIGNAPYQIISVGWLNSAQGNFGIVTLAAAPASPINVGDAITIGGTSMSTVNSNSPYVVSSVSGSVINYITNLRLINSTGGYLTDLTSTNPVSWLQIELWPVPSAFVPYVVEYRTVAPLMVNTTDMPVVESAVIEAKAMMYAAQASYASNGAPQWLELANSWEKRYLLARDDAQYADRKRALTRNNSNKTSTLWGLGPGQLPFVDPY